MTEPHPRVPRDEPVDSDIDLSVPSQVPELVLHRFRVLGVIAAGGVIGALARYQAGRWWPTPTDAFPSTTLGINVLGCLVIGVFMVVIGEVITPHPLLRPFLGTGMLGGFTTFSTYAIDLQTLIAHGRVVTALIYLAGTAIGAVLATGTGMYLTRAVHTRVRDRRSAAGGS